MKVLIYYYTLANNENISDTQIVKLLTEILVSFLLNTREKLSKAVPWLIPQTFGVQHLPLRVNMYLAFLENVGIIVPKDVDCKFSFFICCKKFQPTGLYTFNRPAYKDDEFCNDENNFEGCSFDGGACCGSDVKKNYCSECKCLDPNAGNQLPNIEI